MPDSRGKTTASCQFSVCRCKPHRRIRADMRRMPVVNALGILLLIGVCAVELWRMQTNTLLRQENVRLQDLLTATQGEMDELLAQRDRLRWSQELHAQEVVKF